MAGKGSYESTPLKTLQRFHHSTLNSFGDGETLVEAIHRRPGCYGPNPIAYLSLLARRPGLTLGDVDEALINDRSLVRASAFRNSMFLIPAEDYPVYFKALHGTLVTSGMNRLRSDGIDDAELQRLADCLRNADFPLQKTENQVTDILFPGKERRPRTEVERQLLRKLCDIGVLVRTTSKGWKGNQFNYALIKHWLEGAEFSGENPEPARLEVVRRYLRAYGPARFEDIVWWTGLPATEVRHILEMLGREVVRFLVEGLGEGLLTMREMAETARKGGLQVPERILFLPLWDAYPLGWRDRTRVVDQRFAGWVYDADGNTTSIIVEEGRAIGLWQFRDGDSISLEFHIFEPYNNRLNAVRLAAEAHAAELAKVSGARDVRVVERALPAALAERPAASFLWPLGKDPIFRHSEGDYENPMDRRERVPNVLRSKFLDDERLIRPMLEEEMRKAHQKTQRDLTRASTNTLDGMQTYSIKADGKEPEKTPEAKSQPPAAVVAAKAQKDARVVAPKTHPSTAPSAKSEKSSAKPEAHKAAATVARVAATAANPSAAAAKPIKAVARPAKEAINPAKAPPKAPPKTAKATARPARAAAKPAAKKAARPAKKAARPAKAAVKPAKKAARPAKKAVKPAKKAVKPAKKAAQKN